MSKRGKKSNCTIAGHTLTWAELAVLNQVTDYMRANAGDSQWTSHTSPKGDGRSVPLREIFGGHNISMNAKRYAARRLADLGVLRACEIECVDGALKGVPLHFVKERQS
jgi:hypothetical protein